MTEAAIAEHRTPRRTFGDRLLGRLAPVRAVAEAEAEPMPAPEPATPAQPEAPVAESKPPTTPEDRLAMALRRLAALKPIALRAAEEALREARISRQRAHETLIAAIAAESNRRNGGPKPSPTPEEASASYEQASEAVAAARREIGQLRPAYAETVRKALWSVCAANAERVAAAVAVLESAWALNDTINRATHAEVGEAVFMPQLPRIDYSHLKAAAHRFDGRKAAS